ncbi:MAG: hypothetical protein G8345_01575 [Magnetococcales bacterium]|nr:hypothetical protein [Magnetococcales bacterium]NGZ25560.1 hypothetical protein [Magnetococcales bacterium]
MIIAIDCNIVYSDNGRVNGVSQTIQGDAMSELYDNIRRGIMAGLPATMVLSVLMLSESVLPQFAQASLINNLVDKVLEYQGITGYPHVGWFLHFFIGTIVWGSVFGVVEPILPGKTWRHKGMAFGAGCAFVFLVAIIPIAGAGFFGMKLSLAGILVTILQHLIYGYVLGDAYWRLLPARERMVNPSYFCMR